jgi:activator of HSP90 ATPase
MGKFNEALSDAKTSISLDSSYAKAYYRLGVAQCSLKLYTDAIESLQSGLKLAPGDKEMMSKLKLAESDLQKNPNTATINELKISDNIKNNDKKNNAPIKSSAQSSSKPLNESTIDEDGEDLSKLKGYKKTSDGKMTTYFNHELDEKTKKLIGDITPSRIDNSSVKEMQASSNGSGGSVWNAAGTFESKSLTPWAKKRLEEIMTDIQIPIKDENILIQINKINSISGDAEILMNRGKTKYIIDFEIDLEWSILKENSKIASGTLSIKDVNDERDYDTSFTTQSSTSQSYIPFVDKFIKSKSNGLLKHILEKIDIFLKEFFSK